MPANSAEMDQKTTGSPRSPIAEAVREQLFGDLSPEASSPAIFLMAHAEFLPGTLRAAARIYSRQKSSSAAALSDLLLAEAERRSFPSMFVRHEPLSSAAQPLEPKPTQVAAVRPPDGPGSILALAVEIQKQFGMRLPAVFGAETESAHSEGWRRIAGYLLEREGALLAKLMVAIGALRNDAGLDKGALAALREVEHLSYQNWRLRQGASL